MKVYEAKEIRNVGLIGHGNSGKTSLAAGILFLAGATNRLTRVDEGNTVTDFDDEEIQRKITISTALAYLEWNKLKINLLDTPGFNIFINDTKAALVAADSSLVLVDGVAGVEVQTEKVWSFAAEYHLPRALVINKLDRENANFDRALASIQENFGRGAVPIQLPCGAERDFRGIIDLVRMKCYTYESGGSGRGKEEPIPQNLAEAAQIAQEALIEMVAEGNDALLEEFLREGHASRRSACWRACGPPCSEMRLFPVLCASGLNNVGRRPDSRLHGRLLPLTRRARPRRRRARRAGSPARGLRFASRSRLFVFKTVADPFAGRVSYFKVRSGVLKNDANLTNVRSGTVERLSHIGCLMGKSIQPVTELRAGDIGAVAKLKDTLHRRHAGR